MTPTFLKVLRDKMLRVVYRLHGMWLLLAGRRLSAGGGSSTTTTLMSSSTPEKPAAAEVVAQGIEQDAAAPGNTTSDDTQPKKAVATETESRGSNARSEKVRPAENAGPESDGVAVGQPDSGGQADISESAILHEAPSDTPAGAAQDWPAAGVRPQGSGLLEDGVNGPGAPTYGLDVRVVRPPFTESSPDATVEQEQVDADPAPFGGRDGQSVAGAPTRSSADQGKTTEKRVRKLSNDLPPERAEPDLRRRPRAYNEKLEPAVEFTASAIEDADYRIWNRALATHCLLVGDSDEAVYLTITPMILAAALCEVLPGRLLPEDAEAAFLRSVTDVYHGKVLRARQKLRVLRRCGPDGLPDCIAFLAASVLAAYQMRSDEETAATAYYSRLADILKCDLAGGHPRGFDPDEFEALWRFLEAWLLTEKNRRLALPGPGVGIRRFVALPLTHVPLRRVDIERLPEFFVWVGYEPGANITRSRLDQDLMRWSLGRIPFTNAGMATLQDERRSAVLAQIAHELDSWDGSQTDSLGRRTSRVEILLDVVHRRPELSYLPRRPAAFPRIFDDGVHAFEASDEGWYDPVPLQSEDGRDLADGFEWQVGTGRLRLVLRRAGASAIALPASHEYTGYMSHKALRLGAPGAALCEETLADSAAEYLSTISQQRCVSFNHPGLPEGWRLFTGIKPQRRGETPPAGLEALAVEAAVDLIPTGGLRLGSRWAWLNGAPPGLLVAGLGPGESVMMDGQPITVSEDGSMATHGLLAQPGTHVVEAAGLKRRIEIVDPQLPVRFPDQPARDTAVALPCGSWTILGAMPGQVAYSRFRSHLGTIACCAFPAIWAVEVAGGPGAKVLCLSENPPTPGHPTRSVRQGPADRSLREWVSAIYNATIRRPDMRTPDGEPCGSGAKGIWNEYMKAARDIKRRFRRLRL